MNSSNLARTSAKPIMGSSATTKVDEAGLVTNGERLPRRSQKGPPNASKGGPEKEKKKRCVSLDRTVESDAGLPGITVRTAPSGPGKKSTSERKNDREDKGGNAPATRKPPRRSKSSDDGGTTRQSRKEGREVRNRSDTTKSDKPAGRKRAIPAETAPSSDKATIPLVPVSAPLSPCSKPRNGFEVDAPPRHIPRGGVGSPMPNRRRGVQPTTSASSRAESSVSRHHASLLAGLTDEQRAWAGIEALLLMGHQKDRGGDEEGENSTVATRDVAALDILRAAMASNASLSTQETTRFLVGSESSPVADPGVQAILSSSSRVDVAPGPAMPTLVDMSFSSLRSEATKQTARTAATQNYVVPSHTALGLHRQQRLPSPSTTRNNNMNTFMSQLCQQQHRHQNPRTRQDLRKPSPPPHDCEEPTDTEESIDLFADDYRGVEEAQENGDVNDAPQDPAANADGTGDGSYDDEEESYDDEDDDNHSRMLIQRYTDRPTTEAAARTGGWVGIPDLMDASFSSVRTEMSGIMSLISTAKNYVVQKDDVNPMGVFLGNITRNLERKQEAMYQADDDEARVRYMSERDELADERRKILEEEIERYQSGEYDDLYHDGAPEMSRPAATMQHPRDDASQPSMPSVPSAASVEPTRSDPSPLPSPYSDITPPFEGVRAPAAGDWRAWVDGAFKPATPCAPTRAPAAQGAPAWSNPGGGSARTASKDPPPSKGKKVLKKKRVPDLTRQAPQGPTGASANPRSGGQGPGRPAQRTDPPQQRKPPRRHHSQQHHRPSSSATPQAYTEQPDPRRSNSALMAPSSPPHPHPHPPAALGSPLWAETANAASAPGEPEEEVISLSRLRVPESSCRLSPSDLPRSLPSPAGKLPSLAAGGRSMATAIRKKKKDKYEASRASPLVSLRHRMAQLYRLGKDRGAAGGGRRGSPASVLDFGGCTGGGGGIAGGRGDESRFFPTIEEEDEEDWSNQLLPCAAAR